MELFGWVVFIAIALWFKYLINEDNKKHAQWRANSERRKFQERRRKTMGINYSPDTINAGHFTLEELNDLNKDLEQ